MKKNFTQLLMKTMLLKTLMLVAVAAAYSISAYAQPKNETKQIPEGKWVLVPERIQAFKPSCHDGSSEGHICSHEAVSISIDDIDVELYTELRVRQDSILLIAPQGNIGAKYVYTRRDGISYNSPAIPFMPRGTEHLNMLYVQQRVVDPLNESTPIYISLVYKKEE